MSKEKVVVIVNGKSRIFKYATGEEIPEGAIYLATIKNGDMPEPREFFVGEPEYPKNYQYVWHYFLVEVK
jgi:hypothetical protein